MWSLREAILVIAFSAAVLVATPSHAVDTTYEYDALGRLITVTRPGGTVTNYTLDPAGNRTKVDELLGGATAPTTITVPSNSASGSYTVTWSAAGGSAGTYELFESTNSLFSPQTRVFSGAGTSASISGHGNGTYYYRVRGCNGSACTPYKEGANGVGVAIPPAVPGTVTIPATNNTGNFTITWAAVSGATSYQLTEATNTGFSGEAGVYSGPNQSRPITGKTTGTYFYRVRACNAVACSAPREGTNSVVVTIPPSAPAYVTVPGSTAGTSFTISWAAVAPTVTAYQLYESTSASFTSQTLVYDSTGTSAVLNGRTSSTYYYRVRACNAAECSTYTQGANGILVDLLPPSAPGTLTFNIVGTNVTAYYGPASDNVGVTGYEYMLNGAAGWSVAGSSSTGLSGLTHNTAYTFYVRARDGVGNAGNASSAPFTSGPPIPGVPTGLAFNQTADCAWAASWGATTHATYYRFSDTQTNEWNVSGSTSTAVNCPTGNPEANKPKWVKACNGTGCGGQADFGAPIDVTPPTTPGTPQFSSVTSNSATVTWAASFDFSGIANYQYNIGAGWVTIGSAPNVALTGLSPQTNYTFQVRARDNANLTGSPSSAPLNTPAAPDTTPPSQPGTITMGVITSTNAPASWGPASDNVGVTGYEFRLNGAATWNNLGLVTSANFSVIGGTSYTLEIRARDGAGNVGSPATKTFSTPAPIPAKPTNLNRWNPGPDAWYAQWVGNSAATFYRFLDNAGIQTDTTSTNIQYQCPWGDCPYNRPKWVKACNGSGCSDKADFAP